MDYDNLLTNIRLILGVVIMAFGVIGNIIGKFDLITFLIIIGFGLMLTETASLKLQIKKIEVRKY